MKVQIESSTLVKPIDPPINLDPIPLTVFDSVTDDAHIPLIYAYKPPTPSNESLLLGLRNVLSEYRELAGRFGVNEHGHRVILLNDEGVTFIEALANCTLDLAMLTNPSPALLCLHPCFEGASELAQVQLTRFTCGSLVVGFSANHMVADGHLINEFLQAWGRACRGLVMNTHPFHDRTIFVPRNPPQYQFVHRGFEFDHKNDSFTLEKEGDLVMEKVHFTDEFVSKIKAKASLLLQSTNKKPYSTFESLMAHVWRAVAKASSLDGYKSTCLRIAVNGRTRLKLDPPVPNEYFGNLVLWAYPRAELNELISEPLSNAASLIHEGVTSLNDDYFKSFIDFASYKVEEEGLIPKLNFSDSVTCLNLNIDSWLGFRFSDLDFGGGRPDIFTPSYRLWAGQVYIVPSIGGDGSIDVFLALFRNQMDSFKEICHLLD